MDHVAQKIDPEPKWYNMIRNSTGLKYRIRFKKYWKLTKEGKQNSTVFLLANGEIKNIDGASIDA